MKNQIRHIPSWIQTLKPKSNTHPDDKFNKTTQVNNKQRTKNQTRKRGKKNESFTWGKRVVESPSWFAENEEQESNAKSMPKQIRSCLVTVFVFYFQKLVFENIKKKQFSCIFEIKNMFG